MSITDARQLAQNPSLLSFYYLSISDAEKDQRGWLEKSLGIRMTPEQVHRYAGLFKEPSDTSGVIPDVVWMPLIAMLRGKEFWEQLAQQVSLPDGKRAPTVVGMGDYKQESGEEIIPMSHEPKGAWMDWISRTGVYSQEALRHMEAERNKRGQDPNSALEKDLARREREKSLSDVSKEDHIRNMQTALGTAPLVPPEGSKDRDK